MKNILERFYSFADCAVLNLEFQLLKPNALKQRKTLTLIVSVFDKENLNNEKVIVKLNLYEVSDLKLIDDGKGRFGAIMGAAYREKSNEITIDFDPIPHYDENNNEIFSFDENSNFTVSFKKYDFQILDMY